MTTYKYITLTDRAETLCAAYMECVCKIDAYTTDLLNGKSDKAILLSATIQRRNNIYTQLALLEGVAIDILSNREFARYARYVNVMLSPLN